MEDELEPTLYRLLPPEYLEPLPEYLDELELLPLTLRLLLLLLPEYLDELELLPLLLPPPLLLLLLLLLLLRLPPPLLPPPLGLGDPLDSWNEANIRIVVITHNASKTDNLMV